MLLNEEIRKSTIEDLKLLKAAMLPLIKESEILDSQASNSIWVAYGQLRTAIATLEDDRAIKKVAVADADKIKKGFKIKTFQDSMK